MYKVNIFRMQHEEVNTCMYKIDSTGMQHGEASNCMYKVDGSGMQHKEASTRLKAAVCSMAKQVPVCI